MRILLTVVAAVCISSQAYGQAATWRTNALKACKTERCRNDVEAYYDQTLSQGVKFLNCVEAFSLDNALNNNEVAQTVANSGVDACSAELGDYRKAVHLMIDNDPRGRKPEQERLDDQIVKLLVENAKSQALPRILVLRAERKQKGHDSSEKSD